MELNEIKEFAKNCNGVLIRKQSNGLGNYGFQLVNKEAKWCIGTFKNYDDAVTFFYLECNFTKEKFNGSKFIVLEK